MAANPLRRALLWLGQSSEDLASDEAVRAAQESGALTVVECRDRQSATLRGRIAVLTLRPRSGTPWLEAELTDGSASITLIWMGRREIPGIVAGRELSVTGRVSWVDGRRRMYNPQYELL